MEHTTPPLDTEQDRAARALQRARRAHGRVWGVATQQAQQAADAARVAGEALARAEAAAERAAQADEAADEAAAKQARLETEEAALEVERAARRAGAEVTPTNHAAEAIASRRAAHEESDTTQPEDVPMSTTTTRPTIQSLAAEAVHGFEVRSVPGTEFVRLTDDAPAWLKRVCMLAHGDMLPDDWRYVFIESALRAIAATETWEEAEEYVIESVSVYTHDLTGWLHSHGERVGYMTYALEGYGCTSGFTALALAQEIERREVLGLIWAALEEVRDR